MNRPDAPLMSCRVKSSINLYHFIVNHFNQSIMFKLFYIIIVVFSFSFSLKAQLPCSTSVPSGGFKTPKGNTVVTSGYCDPRPEWERDGMDKSKIIPHAGAHSMLPTCPMASITCIFTMA